MESTETKEAPAGAEDAWGDEYYQFPASFGQRRLWFVEQLDPSSGAYNMPLPLRLVGALDAGALERALHELTNRHEALRTRLAVDEEGEIVQQIAPALSLPLPVVDLSDLPAEERARKLRVLLGELAFRPFALDRGPLCRFDLLRLAEDEHILHVNVHHAVFDGQSHAIFLHELAVLYEAFVQNEDSPLPEPALQYVDFAHWQREQFQGPQLAEEIAYWRRQLAGAPASLDLPTDAPPPKVLSPRGGHVETRLSVETARALRSLAESTGATMFMLLLAAFEVLLHRYTGQRKLVLGTPITNRGQPELEEVVGFFVNMLPICTDLGGDPTFTELLRRVREVCLDAFAHQHVPFDVLAAELAPDRSASRMPLFQAVFSYEPRSSARERRMAGVSLVPLTIAEAPIKFELGLDAVELEDGGIGLAIDHSLDLWRETTIAPLLEHFCVLLDAITRAPGKRIGELALMSDEERGRVLSEWNQTEAEYPRDVPVGAVFSAQARRHPSATAISHGDRTLTYGELEQRANRLARRLLALGVEREGRVGVCLERSIDFVVCVLGILKAGAAYVPLDPGYPDERLRYMLEDAGCRHVLGRRAELGRMEGTGSRLVCVEDELPQLGHMDPGPHDEDPGVAWGGDALGYVMYTSGSTGRPKGVMVPHRGVLRIAVNSGFAPLGPADVVAHLSNVSFDAATWEIWGALLNGARLAVFDRDEVLGDLGAALRARGATALFVTAALFNRCVDEAPRTFASVEHVLVGGEALDATRVRRALTEGGQRRVINGYGPTECVTFSTTHEVRALAEDAAAVPIGRGVGNLRAYVLDRHGNPAPIGVPGELFVAGDGIARGYQGKPAMTAARFVPDPFSSAPGARMYRTGDIARWNAEGRIDFLGRADQQVKIRGFRIEPGEIEAVLREHVGVVGAIVVVKGQGGDKRLLAYVEAPAGIDDRALHEHLRARLPEYMQPAAVVVLDRLPLSPGGKVDRAALPDPTVAGAGGEAPRTPVEEALATIWREVLGRERVGIRDNFFELGGHSLLATRLVSRLRTTFGVELPLRELFESPTIEGLARRISATAKITDAAPPRVHATGPAPLSFTQEGLWFLYRMQPGSAAYNVACALDIEGSLDVEALGKALRVIVERHEALRMVFTETDAGVVQEAAEPASFSLVIQDLEGGPDLERALGEAERAEISRPFDLERGPIFRATLIHARAERHVLVLNMHHIVSDGWSLAVVMRELEELYGAFREGRAPRVPDLPMRYADYAQGQRDKLGGAALDELLAWWIDQIGPVPPELALPTDGRRAPLGQARAGSYEFALPPELTGRVRRACERASVTSYMLLLAVFQLLLHRYSGQEQLLLCTPVGNRTSLEVEPLVGFFVNTLVLPADLRGNPTFLELLRRTSATTLEALSRQELPFEKLVARLNPERDARRNPLTQVMFLLQNQATPEPHLDGLAVRMKNLPASGSKFDLTLGFIESEKGLVGTLEYDADLFTAATIERMAAHFLRLLEGVVADPGQRIRDIPLLSPTEREGILRERSLGPRASAAPRCVHRLFEERAARAPAQIAVIAPGEEATYAELDARANRIARHLRVAGVGPESVVGVCLEKSVDLYASILAIFKAGGAYLPLHPSFPDARLQQMLSDSGARLCVTHRRSAARFSGVTEVVCLDELGEVFAALPADGLAEDASPDGLAYVLYTSGSTGRPKGVMVHHGALSNLALAIERIVAPRPGDRVLQFASVSFDVSIFDIFAALLFGATLVCGSRDETHPGPDLVAFVRRHGITVLILTPSALAVVPVADVPHLRVVAVGGEASRPALLEPWARADRSLLNYYGPTETTVFSSVGVFQPGDPVVSIGPPIENESGYILDEAFEPVPDGVPGELYIGGVGVARGYLGRPGLTAERFLPDPFDPKGGARMYRTGDRVRRLPSGAVEYLGRLDQQVKIRGFRIEPGEIEVALRQHPGIEAAAVVLHRGSNGDDRLVAYVAAPSRPSDEVLREHLGQRLPDYMVPAAFVWLPRLPLTANGKLDRAALPAPIFATEGAILVPRNPTEQALAQIWSEVLGREGIGIHDNFFRVGGHSLLATQVVSRIRTRLGVELPLPSFFEAPTIAALAQHIAGERRAEAAPEVAVGPSGRREAPLSFAQEGLWFLYRMAPTSTAYNIPTVIHLEGPLDVPVLEGALHALVERHEALRTVFAQEGERVVQRVQDAAPFTLAVRDIERRSDTDAALAEVVRAEVTRPFDLEHGPVLRALLVRVRPDRHALVLTVHHIVADGWSLAVLFRELEAAYVSFRAGQRPALAPLPRSYADHAYEQRERLAGPTLEALLSAWARALGSAPTELALPTDGRRSRGGPPRAGIHPFVVPPALADAARRLCEREGVTLYMLLLATFYLLLHRYSGQDEILVGTAAANRDRPEIEPLVGLFVSTLVLRGDLRGQPSFLEVLRRTGVTTLEALSRQELPFEKLVERLNPRRDPRRNPLFQVMFLLQNQAAPTLSLDGLDVRVEASHGAAAKFDLTLGLVETDEGLSGSLQYDADLFEPATIEAMARHYLRLLAGALDDPGRRIDDLPLLSAEERRSVLHDRSLGPARELPPWCVHRAFEQHAARAPDHPAVITDDERASYAMLDARANRIARLLRDRGVGPETVVAVCLPKSVDLYASLLAILKAGGAYLPLHPEYPSPRLAQMLSDSGARLVVTTHEGASRLPASAEPLCLDALHDVIDVMSADPLDVALLPESLAYVLYTSGSTGRPKGVMVPHRGLTNLALAAGRSFAPRPDDRILQLASAVFDASILDIVAAFAFGATLVCGRREATLPGPDLRAFLERHGVTVLHITPSALAVLPRAELPRLRIVAVGGEASRPELLEPWAEGREVLNCYGPTEITVISNVGTFAAGDRVVSLGPPIDNARVYLLDDALEPVPDGVPGEIYVGGAGVARGYLGRAALTAERFLPDPFGTPGARMYRTGDRARRLFDGALEYLGRRDQQLKLRGHRIELSEIEIALRAQPGVRHAVVRPKEMASGDVQLVAYLVAEMTVDAPAPLAPDALARALASELPAHMVPAAFVVLDALPLNASGKLDEQALPRPDLSAAKASYVAPRDEREQALCEVMAEVLGVGRVGLDDDFFQLGGHSLLAVQFAGRIEQRFGRDIPIAALFGAPTPRGIARLLREAEPSFSPLVLIHPSTTGTPVFWVHPVGGNVLCYAELARRLGARYPSYGLQAFGLTARHTPLEDVGAMAERYLQAVLAARPEGPYVLAGWSMGGLVAHEMAVRLHRAGRRVARLLLLDTQPPDHHHALAGLSEARMVELFVQDFQRLVGEGGRALPAEWEAMDAERLLAAARDLVGRPAAGIDLARWTRLYRVFRGNVVAAARHRPEPFPGVVIYARPRQSPLPDSDRAWSALAGELSTIDAEGDHYSMLHEPHVASLADRIEGMLRASGA
ncbi:non-ribosomal peptide synthetase [Polyangium sp. 15x6]|uniref:amino acid adenylation domain-containing protein n=1 Tax=Polyangium sp. 15x6 TaxID=3042687 RepID=UPI00249CAD78|nr:non-ribosomal peptide synthetase [Polyangium sp. 15x6]MDI3288324.1 amino acid adenylation domain-containing protein [Polyangium sp. 15x6]